MNPHPSEHPTEGHSVTMCTLYTMITGYAGSVRVIEAEKRAPLPDWWDPKRFLKRRVTSI